MLMYLVIIFLAILCFVLLTDPYCLLGKYNVDKRLPFYTWAHYNFLKKFESIDVGVVGSSAINYYSSSVFEQSGKSSFFMGVESSNIYEHLQYGRLLLSKKPRELFFFYTFYSLNPSRANQPEYNEFMVKNNNVFIDIVVQYCHPRAALDAVLFWYKKVFGWKNKYQLFNPNGLRTQAQYLNRDNYEFKKTIGDYFSAMSIDPHYYASEAFKKPDSILPGINAIQLFVNEVQKSEIEKLILVSTPLYRLTIALIYEMGLGDSYENYRREMAKIGPFVDLNLDLEFTRNPDNWWDSHHARKGDVVIEKTMQTEFLVDLNNVEETMGIVRPTDTEREQVRRILEDYPDWQTMKNTVRDRVRKTPPLRQ